MPEIPCPLTLISSRSLPVCLILVLVLVSAGCTGSPGMLPDATVPTSSPAGTDNACTFDRLVGNFDEQMEPGDSCYFHLHTPMEFLDDLHTHPGCQVPVIDVPDHWITHDDVQLLMQLIDSPEPAAPVVSLLSSYRPFNQTSTVGNEALFLIEGYRTGQYPPALCSLYYFHPNRTEVRSWWETYGMKDIPDEREAVRILQNSYPELKGYPSTTFAGRSIRTERAPDGWYVAFIQHGSGVPIISARCYCVGDDRTVTLTGTVNQSIMVMPWEFSPRKCG
ncbi:MAG TPA: hypothetical protein P5263_03900 [Methanoregulaceae archaeon]|nr:hypothetical protein [Methanoregulaceae archaeon]